MMIKSKYFIITIDTEADNQWDQNHKCSTKNAKYLSRFQELAEKYEYKPVWLTTYEMAQNKFFVNYFKDKQNKGLCEIGMHLHAWSTPPHYKLKSTTKESPYLIEYPIDIMEEKIKTLDELLNNRFGIKPISHRAGRWTTNNSYFELLKKYGYKIDCSVTPRVSWQKHLGETGMTGSNYINNNGNSYIMDNGMMEVPMTIKKSHCFQIEKVKSIKQFIKEMLLFIIGRNQWIRPSNDFLTKGIIDVINQCNKNNEYIMFMIHSSELMPGGSPNFKTKESIELLYQVIEKVFEYTKEIGYKGITLKDYYSKYKSEVNHE